MDGWGGGGYGRRRGWVGGWLGRSGHRRGWVFGYGHRRGEVGMAIGGDG